MYEHPIKRAGLTFNRILLEFLARAEKSHVPHGAAAREAV